MLTLVSGWLPWSWAGYLGLEALSLVGLLSCPQMTTPLSGLLDSLSLNDDACLMWLLVVWLEGKRTAKMSSREFVGLRVVGHVVS